MSSKEPHIVIVGAGQAGLEAAETLRNNAFEGCITLVGTEPHGPYHRPPLSKDWLTEAMDPGRLSMRDPSVLERKKIELRLGTTVTEIDAKSLSVKLTDGSGIESTGIVLATGATPRRLADMDALGDIAQTLRTREQGTKIAEGLKRCREQSLPLVVIGGGFIGLEVAASARKLGVTVAILEAAPRLLERALSATLSDWYRQLHTSRGAEIIFNARVSKIEKLASGEAEIILESGRRLVAGLIVVGIGATPNDELARNAGIECDRGILVNDFARTSAEGIVAAGDCAARRLTNGVIMRLESVHNAVEQGRSAAFALLGKDRPFDGTPWFWSDQYECKLQIAGLSGGADRSIVRGDLTGSAFSIFHYLDDELIAVDSINAARDHMAARQLIAARVSPTPEQACDVAFNLGSLRPK